MTDTMPAELAENLIDFCVNRSRVYTLLSRCYEKEVDAGFAEEFSRNAALASDDQKLAEGFAQLQSDLDGLDENGLERLAVVFDRVFFGMGPRTAQKAFPYESVYTSQGGLMMQDAYSEVVRIYRAACFEKNPGFTEPEDHLAVELAFMARLCDRAGEALRAGDEERAEASFVEQRTFSNEHLLNWIERFCKEAQVSAEDGFYAHLAAFTVAYVQADEAAVADVIE